MKRRRLMPTMRALLNKLTIKSVRVQNEPLWISKIDLEDAYGPLKLSAETSRQNNFAITGRNTNGYYRFKRGFLGLSDISTLFREKIDRSPKYPTAVCFDDKILVTRGTNKTTETFFY